MLIFADVKQQIVTVSVSNDLNTDQRVSKVCDSLIRLGFQVKLLGRKLPKSKPIHRTYYTKRFKLLFNKGPLFYFNLNLVLFFYLLRSKSSILLSNDLDTLPANFFASKLRRFSLIYDSHELFSEVPELINRPKIQAIWKRMEAYFIPRLDNCYTVSHRIAEHYENLYSTKFKVIRNYPMSKTRENYVKEDFVLYQGALNVGRGIESMIKAMQYIDTYKLYIAGEGDIEKELKQLVKELNLEDRVLFLGRLNPKELSAYTGKAKLGLSLEEDMGLNYRYAVPNKVFDYIHSDVPILYAPLIEVIDLLKPYEVGEVLKSREAKKLAHQITAMLNSDKYGSWVMECRRASKAFNWQIEEQKLKNIFTAIE